MTAASEIPHLAEIEAVIFDLDGVLLDSEPLHFQAASRVFSRDGKTLTFDAYKQFIGFGAVETWTAWKGRYGLSGSVEELIAFDQRVRLDVIRGGLVPIAEATALARRLKDIRVPLAIASSSTPETIDAELDGIGMSDVFSLRVSVVQVSRAKPAPDVYLRTAEILGKRPQSCLAIEDSPAGVRAAKAASMTCVAVPTDWTRAGDFREADITLESLRYFPLLML
jgi:HAD superfamily hydrolase (TIGR01509 family)